MHRLLWIPWLLALAAGCGEAPPTRPARPNVLLISIDTLRADHLGSYGAPDGRTPQLDALAARGTRFETAISPAPLTLPSHATLLTGMDPPRHGIRHNGLYRLPDAALTLAERAREAGYATAAVVGSTVLAGRYGLDQGFDRYDDAIRPADRLARNAEHRRAEEVNRRARAWLAATSGPFLLFVHYYDPHAAYAPPPPFDQWFADDPYAGEVAYVDAAVGELLASLEPRGWERNTLVVVTSDHGESRGEHGEETHGYTVYDATQRVPLILAGPGVPAGRVVPGVTRLADVTPTVLALLGWPSLPDADGESLVPLWSDAPGAAPAARHAYVESLAGRIDHGWSALHGIRSDDWLYVRAPRPELYRLADDPAQLRDRAGDGDAAATARRDLEGRLQTSLARRGEADPLVVDAATRSALQALGYAIPETPVPESGIDPKDGLRAYALYGEAEDAAQEGRVADEVRLLRTLVEQLPRSASAHQRLAVALLRQGDADAARDHAARAAELVPGFAPYWVQLGVAERARGEDDAALVALDRAHRLDPGDAVAPLLAMETCAAAARVAEAESWEAVAAGLAPRDPVTLRRLADAWERAGETERALAAYRRVLEVVPDSDRDHMHAAIHLARLGRLEESDRHLARAGSVRDDPRAQRMLADAYRSREARDAAAGGPPAAPAPR